MAYESNRAFSDRYSQEIIKDLRELDVFRPRIFIADKEDDQKRVTDFSVIRATTSDIRVAARVRRAEVWENKLYRKQFTIRSVKDGWQTELDKILAGWGDYIYYGFAHAFLPTVHSWKLGRLDYFRTWYAGLIVKPWNTTNGDGTSFQVFEWDKIEKMFPGFIVEEWPKEMRIIQPAMFDMAVAR